MTALNQTIFNQPTANNSHTIDNQNADYSEISKFTAIANSWWDKNGMFKPLHDINPLRLDWIDAHCFEHFGTPLLDKKIVDIGCGGGILTHSLAQRGATVLGIDLGAENIEAAKLHTAALHAENSQQGRLAFRCISAENLAQEMAEQFDIVTCMEMLEHVPHPQSVLDACFSLLKPNGLLILSTINRNAKSYLFAIIGAEYVLRLLAKGTHDYHKFITPNELDNMAINSGFQRFDLTGLHYNPLSKRYWLGKNVDVNYMMAVIKPNH